MKQTQVLQEIRRMRFMEAYEGWQERRLSQKEAGLILGVHERTFRGYIARYEESGEEGLYDKRLTQASHRAAPVDEVMKMTEEYRVFCGRKGTASSFAGVLEVIKMVFSHRYTRIVAAIIGILPKAGAKLINSIQEENCWMVARFYTRICVYCKHLPVLIAESYFPVKLFPVHFFQKFCQFF